MGTRVLFPPEDGGSRFPRNVRSYLPVYTAPQDRHKKILFVLKLTIAGCSEVLVTIYQTLRGHITLLKPFLITSLLFLPFSFRGIGQREKENEKRG
jgi:hypothetical protein